MTGRAHPLATAAVRHIAVFRALQLGDMLCVTPALRGLRTAYPDAHIVLIGLPWTTSFLSRYPDLLDEVIVFPGAIGFPEQLETDVHLPAFNQTMRDRHFDVAIQLHGSGGDANDIVLAWDAEMTVGYLKPAETRADGVFLRWPERAPEIEIWTQLIRAMGIPITDNALHFPLLPDDERRVGALQTAREIDVSRLVIIHPGAQLPSRRWPAARFAAVADALADDGWQIAITGVPSESALTTEVRQAMRHTAIDLTGATSLGELAALVQRARLLVCNDTGISHISAAVRCPSVVIASGSDTHRWSPSDRDRHIVLADYPPCRPCAFRDCPYGHPCALNISVKDVVDQARMQLSRWQQVPTLPVLIEESHHV